MDAQADSDEEFVVVSTSDDTETPSYPGAVLPQASRLKSNAKLFVKSIRFLPSLLGGRTQTLGTSEAHTRKYSETKRGRNAAEQLVNNYYNSYHITGGFGGSGGEGFDKGGDGGTGQGPTVYFGQPQARESSEFRTIRLGDVKLVKEVVVGGQRQGLALTQPIIKTTEFKEAANYLSHIFRNLLTDYINCAVWIRSLTGELCLDLILGGPETIIEFTSWEEVLPRLVNISLDAPDSEDIIISSLSEEQYHKLCCEPPIARFQWFQVSTKHPVGLGVFRSTSQHGMWVRIAKFLVIAEEELCWNWNQDGAGELLPNLWIRLHLSLSSYEFRRAWLGQANRIFAQLEEELDVEDYVCVYEVQFILRIVDPRHIPEGYLFICPPENFRTDNEAHATLYQ
ncbi:hypothetical protein MSAN_01503600 [Mycena sanguinolenta]|uniref:Uncharacterized protein n=1 Tax=Mycena sanguinolenta TaxID=230812 RepID=A0A8H6Y6N4_9AGAR|nr:hypothetical protein MSAN_01503600 [Mycena sanguinolenta]